MYVSYTCLKVCIWCVCLKGSLMKKTKEEAEATRQAILQSALNTFCEKGYSKTTFDEIAKRINLTKGAVYWHFRNKPDVIAALINAYCERQKNIFMIIFTILVDSVVC